MESYTAYIVAIIILSFVLLYKYVTRHREYWKKQGIPELEGNVFLFGHTWDLMFMKKNLSTMAETHYHEYPNASMVGLYIGTKPVLMVKHPDLTKFVLHSGFSYFCDNPTLDKKSNPLLFHDPFFQNGQQWKDSRGIFVSAFSSKKLKDRVPAIRITCDQMVNYLKAEIHGKQSIELEAKDFFSNYTSGVAASSILGIDGHTFTGKASENSIRKMMNAMFSPTIRNGMIQNLVFLFPMLAKITSAEFAPMWVNNEFVRMIEDVKRMRNNDDKQRNDIMQHIAEYLKQKGMDSEELVAHLFGFFVEQYETSSLLMSAMAYYISKYPKIQEKMREEVEEVEKKHGTIFSYDAINELSYIEQVAKESFRKLSPIGRMLRLCAKRVTLEGPDGLAVTLNPGDQVDIPVHMIHHDPLYWEHPGEFNPDRFSKQNEDQRNKYVFLAFGEGPRMCPGMRMGLLQVKAGIAVLLKHFVIETSEKMKEPLEIDPRYFMTTIRGGYWVQFRSRA